VAKNKKKKVKKMNNKKRISDRIKPMVMKYWGWSEKMWELWKGCPLHEDIDLLAEKIEKKARQEGIELGFIEGYKEAIFIKGEILKLDFKNMQEHLNNMEGIEYSTKLKKLIKKGSEKSK